LVKNPQLAEQLKASLAEAMKASDAEPKDEPDIEAILDKNLRSERQRQKRKPRSTNGSVNTRTSRNPSWVTKYSTSSRKKSFRSMPERFN